MLHHTLLPGVCKPANLRYLFSLMLIGCTPKCRGMEDRFCGSAKTVSTMCINAYWGIFDVRIITVGYNPFQRAIKCSCTSAIGGLWLLLISVSSRTPLIVKGVSIPLRKKNTFTHYGAAAPYFTVRAKFTLFPPNMLMVIMTQFLFLSVWGFVLNYIHRYESC